jgi:hypothetical protein
MKSRLILMMSVLLISAATARAHGGKVDSLGCHNDRKQGNYHCHSGPLAGKSFASKADALKALDAQQSGKSSEQRANQPPSKSQATTEEDQDTRTVYITRTGKKYHGPNCQYLSRSKIPISLKEARKQNYTACSRCGGR